MQSSAKVIEKLVRHIVNEVNKAVAFAGEDYVEVKFKICYHVI
jgi:hypothetical protein